MYEWNEKNIIGFQTWGTNFVDLLETVQNAYILRHIEQKEIYNF